MKSVKLKYLLIRHASGVNNSKILDVKSEEDKLQAYVDAKGIEKLHAMIKIKDFEIRAFVINIENKVLCVPEPHPVVLYYASACSLSDGVSKLRLDTISECIKWLGDVHKQLQSFSNFYVSFTSFLTHLYNSVESFMNYIIPKDYVDSIEIKVKGVRKFPDREDIQRWVKFKDKFDRILPSIHGRKFDSYAKEIKLIYELKELRDSIMHTKFDIDSPATPYSPLFRAALNFEFVAALEAVEIFINHFEPGLIEYVES
ncbi:hypothetical protein ACFPAF_07375 [Hymenobacter endophyticus]|uniref:RiboL-PSP-HEPN domain-containing protein n=1 Tax=Hymenobacter endophyticus TaxID=3076335 RepID=A0ABU3TFT5_9BACT|nr:hypothetical protein [Hymenobacter endophyticus]MDU0370205.1 hypothetical protein [Hymenobacter endophyticus]